MEAAPATSEATSPPTSDPTAQSSADNRPDTATNAVLKPSEAVPDGAREVKGVDFNEYAGRNITVAELVAGMGNMGFQASSVGEAARIIDNMRVWRDPETGEKPTIFLGYTSNLVSSGLRETIRYLVQHSHVSAIVTSAGGVEEDFIKCLAPTYMGAFSTPGASLRAKGMNRIGNLVVPNNNYCAFEDWVVPILWTMLEEQEESKGKGEDEEEVNWTPSKIIDRLGKEISDESSIYYWAHKNGIPVFCPALTDGSLGDMLYFFRWKSSPRHLRVDIAEDIFRINNLALRAKKAGMIILGGGVVKHHIANACLMRNGADWAVFVNTAQEFDGSDAGARPDEAVSWGKIRVDGESVKVYAEATVVFPLLVAATFAKVQEAAGGGEEVAAACEQKGLASQESFDSVQQKAHLGQGKNSAASEEEQSPASTPKESAASVQKHDASETRESAAGAPTQPDASEQTEPAVSTQ
ncbi:DS-domain-containing protein [Aulographum hederae CBS 113979]|uniref:Deoxyhypusine synthase n=1 Tax=Aulographum hederae CBS 113979 TaxID=1176131 RepID=A0A6G1GZ34_9PEZI|nr:DS-domain-containing protein [Aulographum hederae CBS 113979]